MSLSVLLIHESNAVSARNNAEQSDSPLADTLPNVIHMQPSVIGLQLSIKVAGRDRDRAI